VSGPYDRPFFEAMREGSERSARTVAPGVAELLRPRSVVDVGCGTGGWLAAFGALGVDDVLGVDGPWVDAAALKIPRERFRVADLRAGFATDRRFDLALSLEVAEHLPPEAADGFVDSLVDLAPAVLFSAAVPGQGGVQHLNEQWQDAWAACFARHGYSPVDVVRPVHWDDPAVDWWYLQNALLYVDGALTGRPELAAAGERAARLPLRLVHPRCFEHALRRERPRTIGRAVRGLLGRSRA
jgi:SAM-dependent methyltransferase